MIRQLVTYGFVCCSLFLSTAAQAQTHRGEVDTDGRLSPGEIRNPHINYGGRDYKDRYNTNLGQGWNQPVDRERYDAHEYDHGWNNDDGHSWDHGGGRDWDRSDSGDYNGRFSPAWDRDQLTRSNEAAIFSGVGAGQLSRNEERDLRRANEELRNREEYYLRDGYLSDQEHRDLRERENDIQNKINHELDDGEHRY